MPQHQLNNVSKSRNVRLTNLFFQNCIGHLESLEVLYEFWKGFSVSAKKKKTLIEILIGYIESVIHFDNVNIIPGFFSLRV